jgi:hypothetical protein
MNLGGTMTTTIDLKPFCDKDFSLYAFQRPWTVNGKRYATDGRVIVRMLVPGEPDSPPGGRVPNNVDDYFKPVKGKWLQWPEVESCGECKGSREVVCHGCACGVCAGGEPATCLACLKPHQYMFGSAALAHWLAWEISRLPNVMFIPNTNRNRESAVRFKFDGGEGAVMPLVNTE